MEITSSPKKVTLQKISEIKDLLKAAIEHHGHCEVARASVLKRQQVALWHALQVGVRLNKMKTLIRRGDWLDWLEVNFCKPLKISVRTAQVYMKIDADNSELREQAKTQRVAPTDADFQLLTKLKLDTIRKYAYGFIPKKPDLNKDRDVKLSRFYSFVNIVNEYNRIRYRHVCGLLDVNFEDTRKETVELHRFLQWVHGESMQNPWDSYVYPDWRKAALRRRDDRMLEIAQQRFQEMQEHGTARNELLDSR